MFMANVVVMIKIGDEFTIRPDRMDYLNTKSSFKLSLNKKYKITFIHDYSGLYFKDDKGKLAWLYNHYLFIIPVVSKYTIKGCWDWLA